MTLDCYGLNLVLEYYDVGDLDNEPPRFNKRGGSKHSFKHPSIESNQISESTGGSSGWEDSQGLKFNGVSNEMLLEMHFRVSF